MRQTVVAYFRRKMGRAPNLEKPSGYNDRIQWLKLYDQMPEHVICCDKWAVRSFVREQIGAQFLLPVFSVASRFEDLLCHFPSMVKASHDSGSVAAVRASHDWAVAGEKIRRGLARVYGVKNGEWAYSRIEPCCFTEQLMPDPVIDYKFHCVEGQIRWVQIISDRKSGRPREVNVSDAGEVLPFHLDHDFRHELDQPDLPKTWPAMVSVARVLSERFRYVRVDLYSSKGSVYFGELTFWPKSGCYRTQHDAAFGAMLDFDMSYKRPPLA